jgi:DNA-binding transcriptional ArsR family regulator
LTFKQLLKYYRDMSRPQATTDVFYAIADPTRRALLDALQGGEKPFTELASQFDVTLSAVSQHLQVLRQAGLVSVRKAGRQRCYELNAVPLQTVADWVATHEAFWRNKFDALAHHLEEEP